MAPGLLAIHAVIEAAPARLAQAGTVRSVEPSLMSQTLSRQGA